MLFSNLILSLLGCMFALTTIVLIDLFGIQLFGPIYGNISFLRGLAAVAGPPFAGELSRSIIIHKISLYKIFLEIFLI